MPQLTTFDCLGPVAQRRWLLAIASEEAQAACDAYETAHPVENWTDRNNDPEWERLAEAAMAAGDAYDAEDQKRDAQVEPWLEIREQLFNEVSQAVREHGHDSAQVADARKAYQDHCDNHPENRDVPAFSPGDAALGDEEIPLTWASDVTETKVDWCWQDEKGIGWLPNGNLTLLAGRGGEGKSLMSCWIAAKLTRGELPGMYFGKPQDVVIYNSEDSHESVLVGRLRVNGADLTRVRLLGKPNTCVDFAEHWPDITEMVRKAAPALLVIDPVLDLIDGDHNNVKEVRAALEPAAALAAELGMVVIGIAHHKKAGADAAELVSGSHGYWDRARCVIQLVRDKEGADGEQHIVGISKSNYGQQGSATYDITGDAEGRAIFSLGEASGRSLDEAAASVVMGAVAKERYVWLAAFLADGERSAGECQAEYERSNGAATLPADLKLPAGSGPVKWDTFVRGLDKAHFETFRPSGVAHPPTMYRLTKRGARDYESLAERRTDRRRG